jgi:hypothetical protein
VDGACSSHTDTVEVEMAFTDVQLEAGSGRAPPSHPSRVVVHSMRLTAVDHASHPSQAVWRQRRSMRRATATSRSRAHPKWAPLWSRCVALSAVAEAGWAEGWAG